jgi:hypothetical protein
LERKLRKKKSQKINFGKKASEKTPKIFPFIKMFGFYLRSPRGRRHRPDFRNLHPGEIRRRDNNEKLYNLRLKFRRTPNIRLFLTNFGVRRDQRREGKEERKIKRGGSRKGKKRLGKGGRGRGRRVGGGRWQGSLGREGERR